MTRRLLAILSADAVGYSRLMAADEAGALRQVDAQRALLREQIEAHGGRVVDAVGPAYAHRHRRRGQEPALARRPS